MTISARPTANHSGSGRVVAVLGPTNTGKTHFAVERMLAHRTGMMGFPLRLLAREIYDRIVALKGEAAVALVTGEEKIGPDDAAYIIATVEAMPVDRKVEFLAVDEIQLAADPSRGHVFTDRLLNARGSNETMFMGSATVERQLRRLIDKFELITRPRFSLLTHVGTTKLSRLPRRSAVVAFTANDVYALAELVRRQQGGAAVVLGALSPRTRNAQVEMYQSGEVDHLVATDAIGMGLNMDLSHVTFAKLEKFDGRQRRQLHAPELAQIAGRAGRHMANGTFSVARGAGELDSRLIEAVENHHFAPLRTFRWRNSDLDLSSLATLQECLNAPAPSENLIKVRDALDDRSLAMLSVNDEVRERALGEKSVRLLWQVCQIPDFRRTLTGAHLSLLSIVFKQIHDHGRLDESWVASMVARLEQADGEIDALVNRIAHIRTWTYLSQRADWFDDPSHWKDRARAIEDRLSDALHDRLTQRFVDRRTAALMRSIRERGDIVASIGKDDEILVDGHAVGKLDGLALCVDSGGGAIDDAFLTTAVRKAAKRPLMERVVALLDDEDSAFSLDERNRIIWQRAAVAVLRAGPSILKPSVQVLADDSMPSRLKERITLRLSQWVENWVKRSLGGLLAIKDAMVSEQPTAAERSIFFALVEGLGSTRRQGLSPFIANLDVEARSRVTRQGVRLGLDYLYVETLLKAKGIDARARLLRISGSKQPKLTKPGAAVIRKAGGVEPQTWICCGYHLLGSIAIRQDMFERLSASLRSISKRSQQFVLPLQLAPEMGLSREELTKVMCSLNYKQAIGEDGSIMYSRSKPTASRRKKRMRAKKVHPVHSHSPFAALRNFQVVSS